MYEIKTSPDHNNTGWPPGVKYIIGNEGSERFSYYGMKAILWVYLSYLYTQVGYIHAQGLVRAPSHIPQPFTEWVSSVLSWLKSF